MAQRVILTVKVDAEVAERVRELANSRFGGKVSRALEHIITGAVGGGQLSGLGSADAGYNDGLRQGLHEARTVISAALKKKWRT